MQDIAVDTPASDDASTDTPSNVLKVKRLGIDTHQEPILYMRDDCPVCRSEGFEAQSRVSVAVGEQTVIATLNIVEPGVLGDELLGLQEAGLSDAAWRLLDEPDGKKARLSHPEPVDSLRYVRSKIYGHRLQESQLRAILEDIAQGRYADVHLAAFLTACANERLDEEEVVGLTRAMVDVGERIEWDAEPVVDKHCVGGLPGNRTTPLIVSIVAACGLTIPKTSSRAITSPAGTADTMETLAPVDLSMDQIRRVVHKEGGCVAWGGGMRLSPVDDVLIRVERTLDLDSPAQLVASVLSKKIAAGSSHVVIDVPVGPTAKVRSKQAARKLESLLEAVAEPLGLELRVVTTDGSQPVGRGIGPSLEARDVLAVLQCKDDAPRDLRERALMLAGHILELSGEVEEGCGEQRAAEVLDEGRAWAKFQAICEAQGGMRTPPEAPQRHEVCAPRSGCVGAIDNRKLARAAKLAGAPDDLGAGLDLHVRLDDRVGRGQPVFTLHADTPGELEYALDYIREHDDIITLE